MSIEHLPATSIDTEIEYHGYESAWLDSTPDAPDTILPAGKWRYLTQEQYETLEREARGRRQGASRIAELVLVLEAAERVLIRWNGKVPTGLGAFLPYEDATQLLRRIKTTLKGDDWDDTPTPTESTRLDTALRTATTHHHPGITTYDHRDAAEAQRLADELMQFVERMEVRRGGT